jgi:hypothetical protein
MLKSARTYRRCVRFVAAMAVAFAAMVGSAGATPITLDVTVNSEFVSNLVNGKFVDTNNSVTPVSFQLTVTPDFTITSTSPPSTVAGGTGSSTTFGAPQFSTTPFTASLLALNNQGPLSESGYSIATSVLHTDGSSIQQSLFRIADIAGSTNTSGTGVQFSYVLELIANRTNTLKSVADVVQPTAQTLLDNLDLASEIQFDELEVLFAQQGSALIADSEVAFEGTATMNAASNVPEPGTISLFGVALLGLCWLHRRKAN